jgi:hypothetical protein
MSYFGYLTKEIANQVFKNSVLNDLFFVKDRKKGDIEGERIEGDLLGKKSADPSSSLRKSASMTKSVANIFGGSKTELRLVT